MRIAIAVSPSNLPKFRKTVKIIEGFGPINSRHSFHVFTTRSIEMDVRQLFRDIPNCVIKNTLPAIVRQPPLSSGEPFFHVASQMIGNGGWFYLTHETIPLCAEWADMLESEYLISGKQYLGAIGYKPNVYIAESIRRVNHGEPYMLESAIYPGNLLELSKYRGPSMSSHHEILCRGERVPNAKESQYIVSAEWNPNFASPIGAAIATRMWDNVLPSVALEEVFDFVEPKIETSSEAETTTAFIEFDREEIAVTQDEKPSPLDAIVSNFEPTLPEPVKKVKVIRKPRKKRAKKRKTKTAP